MVATASLPHSERMPDHEPFPTLADWAAARVDMRIECACGRTVNIPLNQILGRFRFDGSVSDAADRLRCKRCGERGKAIMERVYWTRR